jgi:hypothetical protein
MFVGSEGHPKSQMTTVLSQVSVSVSALNYDPIDLNQYLDRLDPYQNAKGRRKWGCFHCPACHGKLSVGRDGTKFTCFGCSDRSAIRKALVGNDYTPNPEWERIRVEKEAAERHRIANLKSSDERHRGWLDITSKLDLTDLHRQQMLDRGYSPELIELSNARSAPSYSGGRIIPILDYQGRMVGGQIIKGKGEGKPWYGASGTNTLKETGELPLTVIYPKSPKQKFVTDRETGIVTLVGHIAYVESTGDKPWLCADMRGMVTIGSSSIGSQPNDLKRSIEGIRARFGWDTVKHVLMADGGSLSDDGVMRCYRALNAQITAAGGELLVGWWGQYEKSIRDIDEIPADKKIHYVTFKQFERMGEDWQLYSGLSRLNIAPTETRNERFLTKLPTISPGTIGFISSPCATGKTTVLVDFIADRRLNSDGKIIDIVPLNSIKSAHQKKLNIPEYRVGFGLNDEAINSHKSISICIDSLLRLELENIPARSTIILDEFEALIKHLARSSTLSTNAAATQAHFTQIIDRVLMSGGVVIALEDSLTDVSIQGLLDQTGNRYGYQLLKNDFQPFKWQVAIGGGSNQNWLSLMLDRLERGEKIFAPNTSQRYGEAVERLVLEYLPELAGKIERVDAKTSPDLKDLLRDPNKYLAGRDVRLLIGSPTIKSGFDSSNEGQFDRVMARFTNLSTRDQIQLLHRDRSNVPRDIFIKKRGAEASSGGSRHPIKLLKSREAIANRTSLAAGSSKIKNNRIGDIWNRLDAQFSARDALSAQYLEDYLRCDLAERGHEISDANWESESNFPDAGKRFKAILKEIEIEENQILFKADGRSITPDVAISILHSSGVRFEDRQKATKCLLHRDLPGVEFSEEFLLKSITKNRGAYRYQCELNWFLDKSDLVKSLDRDRFTQQSGQPHIVYSTAPKLAQRVDLLAPIAKHLEDLASGREYMADDEAVLAIQAWGLTKNYLFWALFGLTIKASEIDSIGKKQNTAISTTNKILKQLGYKCERTRQLGTGVDRVNVYQITNSDCEHRVTIYQALEIRYREQLGLTHTVFNSNNPIIKNVCAGDKTQPEIDIQPPPDIPPDEIEIDYGSIQNLKIGDRVRYTGNMIAYSNSIGSITGFIGDNYQTTFTTRGCGSVSIDELILIPTSWEVAA